MTSSSSSPDRGRVPSTGGNGVSRGPAYRVLAQLLLDRAQHGLAVGVPALVVAHLAQLRRLEVAQATLHLRGRQVVVARDREARTYARRPPCTVCPRKRRIGGADRT